MAVEVPPEIRVLDAMLRDDEREARSWLAVMTVEELHEMMRVSLLVVGMARQYIVPPTRP